MRIEQSQLHLGSESSLVRQQIRIRQEAPAPARASAPAQATESSFGDDPQGQLLLMFLIAQQMAGKRVQLTLPSATGGASVATTATPPQAQVQTLQVRAERESVQFEAQGSVKTSDGRSIDFEAHLSLSREFVQIVEGEEAANGQDPLILNFDGRGVRLQAERIRFDLNADGEEELVPRVAPGSGILFADLNGDGVATDGSELFGPRSGDGFADLAQHDVDQNGWIDEGDPIFGELRVWMHTGTVRLEDLGVGAISTSSVGTQFDLRTPGSGLLGQIRASGIYLSESGEAGTISHVDLVV